MHRGPSPGGGKSDGRTGGHGQQDSDEIDRLLSLKLKESGFCRDGYIELDRYHLSNRDIRIRGV